MRGSLWLDAVGNLGGGVRAGAGAASPDRRARHRIIMVSIPEAEVEGGVVFFVGAGEFHRGPGGSIAAAGDLHLGAAGR